MQLVTKICCELHEGDGLIGDCKNHLLCIGNADTVSDFFRIAVRQKLWMNVATDDQHRAGLRGIFNARMLLQESICFQNTGCISTDKKDSIRLQIEISTARGSNRALQLTPVLDI